jgi:hypothetical protein
MIRDTHHFGVGDEIGDVTNITATAEEWDASPESRQDAWSVIRDGDEVRATRLTLPSGVTIGGGGPVGSRSRHWLDQLESAPRLEGGPERERIRRRK